MGFVGVDALGLKVEAGVGEEGPTLFLGVRFSIAARMLSRSAISKREASGLGTGEGLYIRLEGTATLANPGPMRVGIRSQPSGSGLSVELVSRGYSASTRDARS